MKSSFDSLKGKFPIQVTGDLVGQRLDVFLTRVLGGQSRNQVVKLIEDGEIRVSSLKVKNSYKLKLADTLSFEPRPYVKRQDTKNGIFLGEAPEICFEDEFLMVLNKSSNLGVHPGNGMPFEETLSAWLAREGKLNPNPAEPWAEELLRDSRQGIVHRLDRSTSGLMIVAKDPKTHAKLSAQIKAREVHRFYWAVLKGNFPARLKHRNNRVEAYLQKGCAALKREGEKTWSLATYHGRDPKNPVRYAASMKEGRRAISHFIQIEALEDETLVEVKLATGRTHQIRVHCAFLGAPVLGDTLYGAQAADRVYLHSHRLVFAHPVTLAPVDVQAQSKSFFSYVKVKGFSMKSRSEEFLVK